VETTGNVMKTRTIAGLLMLVSLAVILSGCATSPPVDSDEDHTRIVMERAEARWRTIMDRDFEASYEFRTPGYRQTVHRRDYERDMARRPFRWLAMEARSADCEGDRCEVRVRVTYQAVGAPAGQHRVRLTQDLTETWIRLDDQWWYSRN
jgi:hypothetical protein